LRSQTQTLTVELRLCLRYETYIGFLPWKIFFLYKMNMDHWIYIYIYIKIFFFLKKLKLHSLQHKVTEAKAQKVTKMCYKTTRTKPRKETKSIYARTQQRTKPPPMIIKNNNFRFCL